MEPSATLYLERMPLLGIINKSIPLFFFFLSFRRRRKDSDMQMNKPSRLTLSSSILCLLAMLLSACGQTSTSNNHQKAPANKQVFVSTAVGGGTSDITHFDPALAADLYSAFAIQTIFTGLVSLDDNGNVQKQLADSWEFSPSSLTWTFHLKPNLKFSDGKPLTSHDIAWSINRALQKNTKSTVAPYYLRYIKDSDKLNSGTISSIIDDSLITPDPNTINIKVSQPVAFFLDTLAQTSAYPVEQSLIEKYGDSWTDHLQEGGGDGPFKVKSYTHQKELDIVPNPNYYGAKPQLQEVIFPFYKQQDATYSDYLANKLDDAAIPLANLAQAKSRPDYHQHSILAINYYTMNYKQKPFDNIHIRQAFELAINKQKITDKVWKGLFTATNHIIPEGMPGYNPELKGLDGTTNLTGNPKKAQDLLQQGLKEEGWNSISQMPPVTLTYASAGIQAGKDEVTELLQEWKDVLNITVSANDIDVGILFDDEGKGANNPLSFYSGPAWGADYPDPEDWTTLLFDKGAAQNGMNYGQNNSTDAAQQQALQTRMEQADVLQNQNQRIKEYNDIEQQLVNDVAWIPMEQQLASGLRKPCVQGFRHTAMSLMPPNDWTNVYISNDRPCVDQTV
jgi:peptide/nickel transport system substrate-binding protein/oligopeptide transport system substrate-binding protein